jgi:hypothetical protein
VQQQPSLAARIDAGIDRYHLYFHKLNTGQDAQVTRQPGLPALGRSTELASRIAAIHAQPLQAAAQATLAPVHAGVYRRAGGRPAQRSQHGHAQLHQRRRQVHQHRARRWRQPPRHAGRRRTRPVRAVCGSRRHAGRAGGGFHALPRGRAGRIYAEAADAEAYYEKGPGLAENGDVNWRMAAPLLADFFAEADAAADGASGHAAKLRFAHAEIVIPFASALGLPGMSEQLPRARPIVTKPVRGAARKWRRWPPISSGMCIKTAGRTLVRMLYNERETDFKAAATTPESPRQPFLRLQQVETLL